MKKKYYSFLCIFIVLMIFGIFLIGFILLSNSLYFTPSNNDPILLLLQKCFNKDELDSFKKYYEKAKIIKLKGGMVFTTPNNIINHIPQITWNGIFLNNLCVEPTMRKKGIGTKLVLKVIKDAKKTGKDHIILQVKNNNIPAIKIYEKLGFTVYSRGKNKKGEEVLIYLYKIK